MKEFTDQLNVHSTRSTSSSISIAFWLITKRTDGDARTKSEIRCIVLAENTVECTITTVARTNVSVRKSRKKKSTFAGIGCVKSRSPSVYLVYGPFRMSAEDTRRRLMLYRTSSISYPTHDETNGLTSRHTFPTPEPKSTTISFLFRWKCCTKRSTHDGANVP